MRDERPSGPSGQRATTRLTGYSAALGAGALWGTTGPLSTALYAEGGELTGVGFWRVAVAASLLLLASIARGRRLDVDRSGLLVVGLGGGVLVALFEVAYQFAIAGAGVAGASALLYTAPVMVLILARVLLGERFTVGRLAMAVLVVVGVFLTVHGGTGVESMFASREASLVAGVTGGLLSALAYAGTTLMARWAVPRYGSTRVLLLELTGGAVILGLVLPLAGRAPAPPPTAGGWAYVMLLALGAVLGANFLFFAALKRIEAAPAAVAATIEPVVGTVLALALFAQVLSPAGWMGLLIVVGAVSGGYLLETRMIPPAGPVPEAPAG